MCGLLILKHLRNLSDESVVEQWSENAYYQYFCGMQEFAPGVPCASSELVHFRHRIGEKGIELFFQESLKGELDNYKRTNSVSFVQNVRSEFYSIIPFFDLPLPFILCFQSCKDLSNLFRMVLQQLNSFFDYLIFRQTLADTASLIIIASDNLIVEIVCYLLFES